METDINTCAGALLDDLPIKNIEHFGRPLKNHLVGTYDLLKSWGNAEYVCFAGLFHSIYGTKTFQVSSLEIGSREDVRKIIGNDAELLVFVFGMSDRKHLLLENRSMPYCWVDYRTQKQTLISPEFLNNLVEIEAANFVEQMPFLTNVPNPIFTDMRYRFESKMSHMSASARDAIHKAFVKRDKTSRFRT